MTADIDEDGRALLDCVRPGLAAELDALRAVVAAMREHLVAEKWIGAGGERGARRTRRVLTAKIAALDALESRRG